jgi:hypothetical protein
MNYEQELATDLFVASWISFAQVQRWAQIRASWKTDHGSLRCLVHMLMKDEKFLRRCTHKAAQVSRIHAYVEDLEGSTYSDLAITYQGDYV